MNLTPISSSNPMEDTSSYQAVAAPRQRAARYYKAIRLQRKYREGDVVLKCWPELTPKSGTNGRGS